jgi:hypothetical protein
MQETCFLLGAFNIFARYKIKTVEFMKRFYMALMAMLASTLGFAQTYCAAGPSSTFDSEITNVAIIGDNFGISNLLTCPGVTGVQDFTATDSVDLSQGTSYTLFITFGTCGGIYTGAGEAWIDFNNDGDFTDAGESIGTWTGSPEPQNSTTYNATFNFAVPTGATLGETRMRIMHWEGGSLPLNSCGTFTWGAVEDYKVVVTNTPPPCPIPGSITSTPAATSATINWISTGTLFDIEYGPIGFTVGTGTSTTSTTTSVTLSNLTANTGYDVYVRNNCTASGNGQSGWSFAHTFFTTCLTVSTFPFTENFDGSTWVTGAPGIIDQCWSRDQSATVPRWQVNTGGTSSLSTGPAQANSGSNYLYLETSGGTLGSTSYLTLPTFDLTGLTTPLISFYYHMFGATMGDLEVQVSLDTGTTWTTVLTKTGQDQIADTDPFKEELVDLTIYKSAHTLIRFAGIRGSSFTSDMAIDDIRIEEAPPCPKPTALSAGNITSSSADISWLSSGTTFVVEYGSVGFTQGTGILDTVTANTATLTGLAGNTAYDVYVLNDCSASGNGLSVWAGPVTFKTLCNAQLTPLFEGFEGADAGSSVNMTLPDCWDMYEAGPSTAYGYATSSITQIRTGNRAYYTYCEGSANDTFLLISPEIAGMDTAYKRIEMWIRAASTSTFYENKVVVGTVSGPSNPGSFNPIDTLDIGSNTTYQYYQVYFDPANGYNQSDKFIAIMTAGAGSTSPTLVTYDDITISNIPDCTPSSNVSFSGITNNNATVAWTPGDGVSFEVEYGPQGFTQGTGLPIYSTADSSYTMTGLASNTCYDVYVRDSCSTGGLSPWFGPFTFCTLCDAQATPVVENFDNTTTGNTTDPSMPDCWFYYETPGHPGWGYTYTSTFNQANSAPNQFYLYNSSSIIDTLMIISPAIQNMSAGDKLVKFWAKSGSTLYDVPIMVGTMGSPNDPSTLHPLDTLVANATYAEFTVYLDTASGYNGTDQHVVIGHAGGTTFYALYVDDIAIEDIPACTPPWNIGGSNITSSTVDLSWSSISGGTFQIEYGLTGFIQGTGNQGIIVNNTTSPHTLTGLLPGTTYDVYIADDCDTTNVTGPFTFTTELDWDVSLDAIEVPLNSCGDSITEIKAAVTNNGINTITSLPITIDVTGGITATISTTSTASLTPGSSDTITVGSINTYGGGAGVMFMGYTQLANDQKSTNDTLAAGPGAYIPAEPVVANIDTVCTSTDSIDLYAVSIPGTEYAWWDAATGGNKVATGDTFTVPTNGPTTYYVQYDSATSNPQVGAGTIASATTFPPLITPYKSYYMDGRVQYLILASEMAALGVAGGGEINSLAFEVDVPAAQALNSFEIKIGGTSVTQMTASYQPTAGMTTVFSAPSYTTTSGWNVHTFTTPFIWNGADNILVEVCYDNNSWTTNSTVYYTTTSFVSVTDGYADLTASSGCTPGAITNQQATSDRPNMQFNIKTIACSQVRKPVSFVVSPDSALASFTHIVQPNGADVDFDASASIGQVYTWDFGDGSSGTGITPSHTYATAGTYSVCLTVADTSCGAVDSICETVVATIGLEETLIGQTMNLYPNPNNGNFRVEFQVEGLKNVELRVMSALGEILYISQPGNVSGTYREEIDLSDEASGVYILQVVSDDGAISRRVTIRK